MSAILDGLARTVLFSGEECAVVTVEGELDLHAVPRLRADLMTLFDAGVRRLVLDLRDCVFLDSSAAALFLHLRRHSRALGGELLLRSPSRQVARFLAVSGLGRCLPVEASPARLDAVASASA